MKSVPEIVKYGTQWYLSQNRLNKVLYPVLVVFIILAIYYFIRSRKRNSIAIAVAEGRETSQLPIKPSSTSGSKGAARGSSVKADANCGRYGSNDANLVSSLLEKVKADSSFGAYKTASDLWRNHFWSFGSIKKLQSILFGLTKAQMKQTDVMLRQKFGICLNDLIVKAHSAERMVITSIFHNDQDPTKSRFFNDTLYKQTITIIKQAK